MGPGWFCDGCGDYRIRGEHGCYSVALAEMRAQRDEARELVRGALKWKGDGDTSYDRFRGAVARWDEEEKKR